MSTVPFNYCTAWCSDRWNVLVCSWCTCIVLYCLDAYVCFPSIRFGCTLMWFVWYRTCDVGHRYGTTVLRHYHDCVVALARQYCRISTTVLPYYIIYQAPLLPHAYLDANVWEGVDVMNGSISTGAQRELRLLTVCDEVQTHPFFFSICDILEACVTAVTSSENCVPEYSIIQLSLSTLWRQIRMLLWGLFLSAPSSSFWLLHFIKWCWLCCFLTRRHIQKFIDAWRFHRPLYYLLHLNYPAIVI